MYHALCRTTRIFTWKNNIFIDEQQHTHLFFFVLQPFIFPRFYFFGCSQFDCFFWPHSIYHRSHTAHEHIAIHFPLSINLYVKACILITCVRLSPILQRNTKFITLIWFPFICVENKCFENFHFFFFMVFFHKEIKKEKKIRVYRFIGYTISGLKDSNTQRPTKKQNENLIRKRSGKDFFFLFLSLCSFHS